MNEQNLDKLTINYLTEEQYNMAKQDGNIDNNQLYMTIDNSSNEVISLLDIYPIGSIYMSVNPTNPSEYFGGTWERWANGRVPVGVSSLNVNFNEVEKTGGECTHQLTIDEMPKHKHGAFLNNGDLPNATGRLEWQQNSGQIFNNSIDYAGGDQPHNNLQPYITCYMWKRTA